MGDQFTPGPWNFYRDEDGNTIAVRRYVTGANGGTVAKNICSMPVPASGRIHPNQETTWAEINANALLIAAAPDLLDMVRRLLAVGAEYRESLSPGLPETATERSARALLAALTKAEGRS